jgi:hypothetical protein
MNMQSALHKSAVVGFSAMALSMLAFSAQALPMVTNGSFTLTDNGPNLLLPSTLPTGWGYGPGGVGAIYSATGADLTGATNGGPLYLWGPANPIPGPSSANGLIASPDGGNYLASDSDPPFSGPIFQTITGLTPGDKYVLTFWYAAAQFRNSDGSDWDGPTHSLWNVSFGTAGAFSTLDLSIAEHGFSGWMYETHPFTVPTTSTGSEVLRFLAVGGPGGQPPVALLDGVSLAAVPEPETLALLGIGLLGILASRRRQQKRT